MYLTHVIEEVFQGNDIEVTFQPYYLLQNCSLLSTNTIPMQYEYSTCKEGKTRV